MTQANYQKILEKKSTLIDNIWGADPAEIQSISKFNKRFRFL